MSLATGVRGVLNQLRRLSRGVEPIPIRCWICFSETTDRTGWKRCKVAVRRVIQNRDGHDALYTQFSVTGWTCPVCIGMLEKHDVEYKVEKE